MENNPKRKKPVFKGFGPPPNKKGREVVYPSKPVYKKFKGSPVSPNHSKIPNQVQDSAFIQYAIKQKIIYQNALKEKFSYARKDRRKYAENVDQLMDWIIEGYSLTIELDQINVVAYDIDIPEVANATIMLLKDWHENCFITRTPRGGAHIFFCDSPELDSYEQRSNLSRLLFPFELFKTGEIVILGQGYPVERFDSKLPLSPVPDFLLPLVKKRKEKWMNQVNYLTEGLIREGDRNNCLCEIAKIIRKDFPKDPVCDAAEVLSLIGHYYCDPPYITIRWIT